MTLVNQAYSIETGNTGISFKCALRLRNFEEAESLLDYLYILKSESHEIIGVVAAKTLEKSNIVSISPLAVHPNHQVKYITHKKQPDIKGALLQFYYLRKV